MAAQTFIYVYKYPCAPLQQIYLMFPAKGIVLPFPPVYLPWTTIFSIIEQALEVGLEANGI
jgi:hypothetical protein